MSGPDRYLSGPFFVQCDSGDLWVILGYSASLHGGMRVIALFGDIHSNIQALEACLEDAEAHGVTPSQVVLRWHIQLGSIPLPKSGDAGRQRENFDVFSFALTDAEMASIDSLERGRLRAEFDPNTHEEF